MSQFGDEQLVKIAAELHVANVIAMSSNPSLAEELRREYLSQALVLLPTEPAQPDPAVGVQSRA